MNNPIIQTDIAEIFRDIKQEQKESKAKILDLLKEFKQEFNDFKKEIDDRFDKIDNRFDKVDARLNKLENGQTELKGEIKTLNATVEQLDKRIANQEFLNRGVFIGLLLALLGGIVNFFGWIPKA